MKNFTQSSERPRLLIASPTHVEIYRACKLLESQSKISVVCCLSISKFRTEHSNMFKSACWLDCRPFRRGDYSQLLAKGCPITFDQAVFDFNDIKLSYGIRLTEHLLRHRSENGCSYTMEELNEVIIKYIVIANALIDYFCPDIIIFESPPHAMYDTMLYEIARHKGIKTCMYYGSPLPGLSALMTDLHNQEASILPRVNTDREINRQLINFSESKSVPFYSDPQLFGESRMQKLLVIFLRSIKTDCSVIIQSLVCPKQTDKKHYLTSYKKRLGKSLIESRPNRFIQTKNLLQNMNAEFFYLRNVDKRIDKLIPGKYIFVPLHVQHEMTSLPSGGFWYDFTNIIKGLRSALPESIQIVVKEHPHQSTNITGISQRSIHFYKSLLDLDVLLAPLTMSNSRLIESALLVAGLTGTSLLEADLRWEVPAISFSKAWFCSKGGIRSVSSVNQLQQAIDCALKKNFYATSIESRIEHYSKSLHRISPEGPQSSSTNNYPVEISNTLAEYFLSATK